MLGVLWYSCVASWYGWLSVARIFLPTGFGLLGCFKSMFAQVFQHHHKLVPAQTCYGVAFAHTGLQTLRNLLQQHVAHIMAESVVESLEIVQIDEQQRTFSSVARTGSQCLFEPVQQEAAGWAGW